MGGRMEARGLCISVAYSNRTEVCTGWQEGHQDETVTLFILHCVCTREVTLDSGDTVTLTCEIKHAHRRKGADGEHQYMWTVSLKDCLSALHTWRTWRNSLQLIVSAHASWHCVQKDGLHMQSRNQCWKTTGKSEQSEQWKMAYCWETHAL